ncbi:uncharacterized protein LOC114468673 [Gouania willdenowi]|uniref:Uncharacterized LOC114468673 n=1 Tax=Gouania willdenowi TaxID=441366 RepID=A0A8C5EYZ0_GOUWI|nr:uncharacterized protein LOC114468673 [Gouania willdenowi]
MALSQLQCLDDNNVNPRTHESKAEFFYCEDQRLALEALLRDGREGFTKYLEARDIRGFLSDPELETLTRSIEPYDPGSELFPENVVDQPEPLSLHYWPDMSDISIPQMDLGWPDSEAYRGVTRTTVYTQPPLEGQVHIKEVVRKIIIQASKVIAVVMDVFTDVDIFRDLIDAGFKRKVSIYILLERTNLPHFMAMCQRANMHTGHLKQLRVRCTQGAEFYTRTCTKVRGQMGHRFMFVDGDKAVSGSYNFTWMSSRLDRNLITVTTGQAVNSFDQLFRFLFANSTHVDLRQVTKESEPKLEPLPQPIAVAAPSAEVARKLYNPKYALVLANNPSPTASVAREPPKEPEASEDPKIKRRKKAIEEEAPPLHPGLVDLEKAHLISYLPIWPEPDPASDVIGFINIRDTRKPTQVHLQRSEMFETSQAIRFSSPFMKAEETLPKEAKPRNLSNKVQEIYKFQPTQNETKVNDVAVEKAKPEQLSVTKREVQSREKTPEQTPALSQPDNSNKNSVKMDTNQNPGCKITNLNAYTSPQTSSKKVLPNEGTSLFATQTLAMNSSKSDLIQKLNNLNTESKDVYKPHPQTSKGVQSFQVPLKQDTQVKTRMSPTDFQERIANIQAKNLSSTSPFEASISLNNPNSFTTPNSTSSATAAVPAISSSPLNLSSSNQIPSPIPSSGNSSSNLDPPVPKPRTVRLVIKDSSNSNSQIHLAKKPSTSADPEADTSEPPEETAKRTVLPNNPDNNSKLQNLGNKETPQQDECMISQETKSKEAVGRHVKMNSVTENVLQTPLYKPFTNATEGKSETMRLDETNPNTFASNSKIIPKTQSNASIESPKKSYYTLSFNGPDVPEPVHSLEPGTPPDGSATNNPHTTKDNACVTKLTSGTDLISKDSVSSTLKNNTHNNLPEKRDKVESNIHTFGKSLSPTTYVREWRTPISEGESITSLKPRSPTPDKFPTHLPTPDSGPPTPDLQSYTPDFRTPTPEISDGYVSSREDSNLSTTSDEYFECSDSPCNEPVFNLRLYRVEDHTSFTHTTTSNFNTTDTISTNIDYISGAADWDALISDTKALSELAGDSPSSVLEKKAKTIKAHEVNKEEEEKERQEDKKGSEPDVTQRVAGDSLETERKDNEETKQDRSMTETRAEVEELLPSRKQRVLNKSTANRLLGEGVSLREPTNDGTESKRFTSRDLKLETVHQREKASKVSPAREKASNLMAQRASVAERREKFLASRGAEEQKRVQQHGSGSQSPSRPLKSPRSISVSQYLGARPWVGRQLNQTESKVLEVLEGPLSSPKSPVRPSPLAAAQGPAVAAAGQRQVSQSQHSPYRQPPTAQSRTRAGQTSNQTSLAKIPPYSGPRNASINPLAESHSKSQLTESQEALGQDDTKIPFNFTFSKLYNLKGLKDKLNKRPQQSKGSTPSSPGEGQISTS